MTSHNTPPFWPSCIRTTSQPKNRNIQNPTHPQKPPTEQNRHLRLHPNIHSNQPQHRHSHVTYEPTRALLWLRLNCNDVFAQHSPLGTLLHYEFTLFAELQTPSQPSLIHAAATARASGWLPSILDEIFAECCREKGIGLWWGRSGLEFSVCIDLGLKYWVVPCPCEVECYVFVLWGALSFWCFFNGRLWLFRFVALYEM